MAFKTVRFKVSSVNPEEKPKNKTLGILADGADEAENQKALSDLMNAYTPLTDCGVGGVKATETVDDMLPDDTFTPTTAQPGSNLYKIARLTVALVPNANGSGQKTGTIQINGIKAAFIDADGKTIKDSGGLIEALMIQLGKDNGTDTPGKGRLSDGQAVKGFISGYAYTDGHPGV